MENNNNWCQSDFIVVNSNMNYVISNSNLVDITGYYEISEYNENYEWIRSRQIGQKGAKEVAFTILENTKYIRAGHRTDKGLENIKIEQGTVATPYSPYGMGSINEYIRPKQLFNIKTVSNGFLQSNTGVVFTNTDWKVSDFIKIYKLIKITFSWVSNNNLFQVNMCYYDKNKNFISGVSQKGADKYKHTFTVPENAYYCKLGYSVNVGGTSATRDKIQLEEGTANTDYEEYKEPQTYTIPTQQPMRSIGDVRDCFVKKSDGWYERHLPYIASYNGETLPQDVYNEVDNVKYCNEKSMSTTGQFSIGASVQYIDENNWNDLPCTEEQIQQLENLPSTYKDFTFIQSQDETEAYLEVSGIYDLNNLINNFIRKEI